MAKAPTSTLEMEYKPRLYLDLEDGTIIRKVKVGDIVNLVVKGKVCSISEREHLEGKKTVTCSSLDLEGYEVKLGKRTMWDDLSED